MKFQTLIGAGIIAAACHASPAPQQTLPAVLARGHGHPSLPWINYTTLTGFFLQDDASTSPSTFDYTSTNFGLINRTYPTDNECDKSWTQWQKFEHYIERLQDTCDCDVQYKLLYMGRHGEGYHNTAETYYGTPAWNCYWSLLDGNGTVTWADAHITPNGVAQAEVANAFWASRIKLQKIPLPRTYYSSPLTRCLQTANITFSGLPLPRNEPFIPTVKELFREGISGHTCDRRGTKTYIHQAFPEYKIEEGFSETDLLWRAGVGEVSTDQDIRSRKILDDVFTNDDNTYLSITSHSGEIASILRVLGHQPFSLSTGAVIPVLVRAETIIDTPSPTTISLPWTTISTCATPPTATAS